ncbi:MAG: GTPase Era [Eggerthellaceae bacterium]|jgi:GTP-binding protein Era
MTDTFLADDKFKSGFIAFLGRPNVGKSTLINTLVGEKIAITSGTAQTTRRTLRAILTTDSYQLILVDTPGFHKPQNVLGEKLNESASSAIEDVDCAVMLVNASQPVGSGDVWVANQLKPFQGKKILVLSKCDLVDKEELGKQLDAASDLASWDKVCTLSAKTHEGVDDFIETLASLMPYGPLWFPRDMTCDQPEEVLIAEFIREKILRDFRDEIPHAIGVMVDEFSYKSKTNLCHIEASIYVEHDSQKGIIIGKGGRAIKRIGTQARKDLERLLDARVYLDLQVKIKKNWRRDSEQIRRFGYGEEN